MTSNRAFAQSREAVTGEQVEAAVRAAGLTRVPFHDCSMCGFWCSYLFYADGPSYDSSCYCTRGWHPPEPRSWQSIADSINMQNPEWRQKMQAMFGFTPAASGNDPKRG